jgi:hypothetical protein
MEQTPVGRVRATVFGLDVHSEDPLRFLEESRAKPTGRPLEVSVHVHGAVELDWLEAAELVCDERQADGRLIFRIWAHREQGYLISGPGYGSHALSADGRRLRCLPEGNPDDAWQRLLIAQVLPFAALLQGLEVFHASAIVRDGAAIAFLGPSGAGKTSLALELCRAGSGFLADDVLSLECRAGRLVAHPGTPVAGVAQTTYEGALEQDLLATNRRERLVATVGARAPAPLAQLFFLERRAGGPEHPQFELADDVQMLLGATFNFVLATPERLRGLLEVCALVAQLKVERILYGPGVETSELSCAVVHRLGLTR